MTAVENKLMMILMRLALSDSASSGLSRPSGETEVNLLPRQKSELKTELVKGSIEQASPDIKSPE
jgi:hypothetical protein